MQDGERGRRGVLERRRCKGADRRRQNPGEHHTRYGHEDSNQREVGSSLDDLLAAFAMQLAQARQIRVHVCARLAGLHTLGRRLIRRAGVGRHGQLREKHRAEGQCAGKSPPEGFRCAHKLVWLDNPLQVQEWNVIIRINESTVSYPTAGEVI